MRCWGLNDFPHGGQLGLGTTETIGDDENPTTDVDLGDATATAISAGGYHTCALLVGGAVRCWGDNSVGQLGLGNTDAIGDDEHPTTDVDLDGATAVAVSAGPDHTCAVLSDGAVRCWGSSANGRLGLGNTGNIGDDENPTTDVDLDGATAVAVSAGYEHTCALLSDGAVRCWGEWQAGRLGYGRRSPAAYGIPTANVDLGGATAVAISASLYHTCALLTGGAVRCWGSGAQGQLGLGNRDIVDAPTVDVDLAGATATAVSTGKWFTCVGLTDGAVRCWGMNYTGQLGLGTQDLVIGDDENPTVDVDLGPDGDAATVTSGGDNTCALLATGALRCWGDNSYGALGLGHTEVIGDDEDPTVNVDFGDGVTVWPERVKPVVTVTTPAPGETLPVRPVISGIASDNAGVSGVRVTIRRRLNGGQYWNGKGWQSAEVTVAAQLVSPGSSITKWTYSFDARVAGVFALSASATDSSNNVSVTTRQTFSI